jgi:Ti-type conjugative transfer relaxase TraA
MAIYHLHAKMVQRNKGQSAVAAAAYRSGSLLVEETTGITHDYTRKKGVEHSEILAPDGAPAWVFDRETLWNAVEQSEQRKDAQVAREIEVGLPVELSSSEQLALLRDYVQREFVSKGMVADIGIHRDNPVNPHAHILLTTRDLTPEGFGQKNRGWNDKAHLMAWRRGWEEVTNEHLAEAGLALRIDHRSYAEQKLDLIPGRKLGLDNEREQSPDLPGFLADRVAEQHRIAAANGTQIIAEPAIALKALSHSNATFTHHDIAKFLHTRTSTADQFQTAYLKVTTSPELLPLGVDEAGRQRFTTRDMFEAERSLLNNADTLAQRASHSVDPKRRAAVLRHHTLSAEQGRAVEEITAPGDLKALVGVAGSGKSTTLAAMREVWEKEGYTVKGAALAGIAAENLQVSSGIESRTLASYELAWSRGRDPLSRRDVLVIDEAGMLGTRQLERVLEVAQKAHAKVILCGDPEQLQAIEAGAPFRGITATHGVSELHEVRRQKHQWQRNATEQLSAGYTADALTAYEKNGGIVAVEKREDARNALLARWAKDRKLEPQGSQLILAYTRDQVSELNSQVRALRAQTKQLGKNETISTESGKREFAVNDRIRFGRNERDLGVKNGSLGTIERIERGVLQIKLDGDAGARVAVDSKFYKHLDYGYATTVHKAQGATVDRTYVLSSAHFDRHTSYVALSRHREAATVFYASDDFGGRSGAPESEIRARFMAALSRARPKELAHDFLEREAGSDAALVSRLVVGQSEKNRNVEHSASTVPAQLPTNDLNVKQQSAAERWAARQTTPQSGVEHPSGVAPSLRGVRHEMPNNISPTPGQGADHSPNRSRPHERDRTPERDGPEHDLEI